MSTDVRCPEIEPDLDVQCELTNGHVGLHRYTVTWLTWSTAAAERLVADVFDFGELRQSSVGPVTSVDPPKETQS